MTAKKTAPLPPVGCYVSNAKAARRMSMMDVVAGEVEAYTEQGLMKLKGDPRSYSPSWFEVVDHPVPPLGRGATVREQAEFMSAAMASMFGVTAPRFVPDPHAIGATWANQPERVCGLTWTTSALGQLVVKAQDDNNFTQTQLVIYVNTGNPYESRTLVERRIPDKLTDAQRQALIRIVTAFVDDKKAARKTIALLKL